MSRTTKFGIFVLALALIGGAIYLLVGNRGETPTEPLRIEEASLRLKWLYDPGFAGELVAAKSGFFQKHGLNLTIRPGGFEADPIKLVAAGADTFGVAGADTFLLARAKGVPIVAFVAGYVQTGVAFYARQDANIHSPVDFIGHRVGYQAGQDTSTIYEALVQKLGVDRSRITEIPVKYDFTPFLTRQLDVWPGYAATQSYILAQRNIPYTVLLPETYGLHYLGTVYFATEETVRNNPKLIQAFVDGLIDGWEKTYENYDVAIPLIASYDPQNLTPDLIRWNLDKQKSSILPAGSRYGEFTRAQWEELQNVLISQRLLSTPVDLEAAMTTRFIEAHYGR